MSASAAIFKRVKQELRDGRPLLQYRIQLVDESLIDEAAAFMVKHFLPTENMVTSIDITSEEGAVEEMESIWKMILAKGISLAAFLEDDERNRGAMISCNVLDLEKSHHSKEQDSEKDHSKPIIQSEKWKKVFETLETVEKMADVLAIYNVPSYIHALGLTVAGEHQQRGIATEMLRARAEVCRMTNTPVSATVFTGEASQRLATTCGYETLSQLDLRTYRINGHTVYSNLKWPVIKWMAIRYF